MVNKELKRLRDKARYDALKNEPSFIEKEKERRRKKYLANRDVILDKAKAKYVKRPPRPKKEKKPKVLTPKILKNPKNKVLKVVVPEGTIHVTIEKPKRNFDFQYLHDLVYKYSKEIIASKKLSLDPDDLINDAYIQLHDAKQAIDFISLRNRIRTIAFEEKFYSSPDDYSAMTKHDTKYCKKCKQELPVGYFSTTKRKKTGTIELQPYCNECMRKASLENYKKNKLRYSAYRKNKYRERKEAIKNKNEILISKGLKPIPISRSKNTPEYMREYQKKKPEKIKEIQRRYYYRKKSKI